MRMVFETLGDKTRFARENLRIAHVARANAAGTLTCAMKHATVFECQKRARNLLLAPGAHKTARMVFGALDRHTRVACGDCMAATMARANHARTFTFGVKHAAVVQSGI